MKIKLAGKTYNVQVATTDEEQAKGLMHVTDLPEDGGMLFVYDEPQTVSFWMKNTPLPLDIIFIDKDNRILDVVQGTPNSQDRIEEDNVLYVLEVLQESGAEPGQTVEFIEKFESGGKMQVLDEKGKVQYEIDGGERIFSIPHTKKMIELAKKAKSSKDDKDYMKLGSKVVEYLNIQDNQEPEYV